jgi:hypothetical protein
MLMSERSGDEKRTDKASQTVKTLKEMYLYMRKMHKLDDFLELGLAYRVFVSKDHGWTNWRLGLERNGLAEVISLPMTIVKKQHLMRLTPRGIELRDYIHRMRCEQFEKEWKKSGRLRR